MIWRTIWGNIVSKLYFIGRTQSEIDIFGGTVYIDIDGKQIGELGRDIKVVDVGIGVHIIKMYKTHTFNTFIGFAEINLTVEENKDLTLRYVAPMLVNQAGHIVVSDFVSIDQIERQLNVSEHDLSQQKRESDLQFQRQEKQQKENNKALIFWIFTLPVIIGLLYFIIEMAFLDSFF